MNVCAVRGETGLTGDDHREPRPNRGGNATMIVFLFLLFFAAGEPAAYAGAGSATVEFSAPSGMFSVGEKLEYEVSYSIFSLGTVSVEIIDSERRGGSSVYRARAFMDSYSGVPFVSLHWMFYSEIDPQIYSRYFSGEDRKDTSNITFSHYTFDYDRKTVLVEKGAVGRPQSVARTSDTISTTYEDGLSLFYYARGTVHSAREANIPTFVNESKVNTYIDFKDKIGSTEIDAIKYPVRTVEFEGRADFVGIFGLTGGFRGWFSDDDAAVPILAKMNVIIGSIRLELVRWRRDGWVPPRSSD